MPTWARVAADPRLDEIGTLGERMVEELRDLTAEMHPPNLDETGLVAALD